MQSLARGERCRGVDAARGRRSQSSVLAQRLGSSTYVCCTPCWVQACTLVALDDRGRHGCRTVILVDVRTRVQTPASALICGSCWTYPAS